MQHAENPLLELSNVRVQFPIKRGVLQKTVAEVVAVSDVSFSINKGEAYGLVGESGCGKTTLARSVLRLMDTNQGDIRYAGESITDKYGKALAPYRKKVAAIFQDPFSSLNPRMKSGDIISEVLRVNHYQGDVAARVVELLELCGLNKRFVDLYPHQMSGGQRQRVGIARALAPEPELIVCDEAVSALDVSIQAQIINLLAELQKQLGLTYLFIGHDLSVVRYLCDRVSVMYLGTIVETASSDELFANPQHPYTQALINAVPDPDPSSERGRNIKALQGEVPSPVDPPSGCVFHPRCSIARTACSQSVPELKSVAYRHFAACYVAEENNKSDSEKEMNHD